MVEGAAVAEAELEHRPRRVRDQLNYVPVEDVWIPAFSVDLKKSGISEWERTMIRFMTDRKLQMINPTHE